MTLIHSLSNDLLIVKAEFVETRDTVAPMDAASLFRLGWGIVIE